MLRDPMDSDCCVDRRFSSILLCRRARTEHTITDISTLASDCTTYFSGDADAFNAAIANSRLNTPRRLQLLERRSFPTSLSPSSKARERHT